jgi:chaperonin cofactor prefoldin
MKKKLMNLIVLVIFLLLLFLSSFSQGQVANPSQRQRPPLGTAAPEVAVSLPDLVVTNYRMQPLQPTSKDDVRIYFDIKNVGSIPASFPNGTTIWRIEGYRDGKSLGMETRYLEVSNGMVIQPKFIIQRTTTLASAVAPVQGGPGGLSRGGPIGLSPGAYQIIVKVDPFNAVREISENNNIFVGSFNVPRFTESVKATHSSIAQRDWRLSQQNAVNAARELQNCDCVRMLVTNIETELKLSEKTMNTAEQLLGKKPINRQVADPIVADLSARRKILEDSMETIKNKRQECMTQFENFDQKANQLFNLLSSVLKAMKEMEQSTIRNIL